MIYKYEVDNMISKINSYKTKSMEDFRKYSKNIKQTDNNLYEKHIKNLNKILMTEDFLIKLKEICKEKKI